MTTTKTDTSITVEQATAELDQARAHYDTTVRAVVAGSSRVTAKHVADAQDAVRFAELRLELAAEIDAARSEESRQQRVEEILASLTHGTTAAKAREVVEAEAQAIAALRVLLLAAITYSDSVRAAGVELTRLGVPDHVHVDNFNGQAGQITIDGVSVQGPVPFGDWVGSVLLGAITRAISPYRSQAGDRVRDLADLGDRALSGRAIGGPTLTAAELVAQQLDHLAQPTEDQQ